MLAPLRAVRTWRFGLYYVVVFGAYVALSLWLPAYYNRVFGLPLAKAALLTALFIFPASLLRPLGGWLSDKFGARPVTYAVFVAMLLACVPLAAPDGSLGFKVGLGAVHRAHRGARHRHGPRQGVGLQVHRRLLPRTRSARRAAWSARWARSAASSCRSASATSRRRPAARRAASG